MQKHFSRACLAFTGLFWLSGCSSLSSLGFSSDYSMYDTAQEFIDENEVRSNGAVVDKGQYYPKSAYSYTYRYCSNSPEQAAEDIAQFQNLARQVCDLNNGQLNHQETGTWCVVNTNTAEEYPFFSASISSTDQWADLCLDGPFVTLKVIENDGAPDDEWYSSAIVLGYLPYTAERRLLDAPAAATVLIEPTKAPAANGAWTEESEHIYTSVGENVCLYERPRNSTLGYTYRGTVRNATDGKVRVLVTEKYKGDIRTAPTLERLDWHEEAYITASAKAWFVCSS
ncbi:hypothetical protein [Photobacterium halotolerans]|uniref:hypothetical protein n=1 Tax=Photobacterium halotolerans TaxID=265726 RepID=UPI000403FDB8|nr:hypothetical protein [Photobacterium halotolerans]